MKKRKSVVDKNLDLLVKFNNYIATHPDAAEQVPKGACIIFADKRDEYLTRKNRALAKEAAKEGERCVRAVQEKGGWRIEPLAA